MTEKSTELQGKSLDVEAVFAAHSLGKKQKYGSHTTVAVDEKENYWGFECKGCQACLGQMFLSGLASSYSYHEIGPLKASLKEIYSSLWRRNDQNVDDALDYWRFCLSDDYSPWRIAAKDSEIIYKDGIPIAYKLVAMDAPCQVIANLCFAMRMPYAQDGYLRMFNALKQEGFNNTESLFIAANVGLSPKGVLRYPYIGDYCFDTSWKDISWSKWSTGTPKYDPMNTMKLSKHPSYSPCNSIWTDGGSTGSNYNMEGRKTTIIQQLLTTDKFEYKGSFRFSKAEALPKTTVDFEKAVKILKKNEAKWKVG